MELWSPENPNNGKPYSLLDTIHLAQHKVDVDKNLFIKKRKKNKNGFFKKKNYPKIEKQKQIPAYSQELACQHPEKDFVSKKRSAFRPESRFQSPWILFMTSVFFSVTPWKFDQQSCRKTASGCWRSWTSQRGRIHGPSTSRSFLLQCISPCRENFEHCLHDISSFFSYPDYIFGKIKMG